MELPSSEQAPSSATKTLESSNKEFARSTTFAVLYEIIEELGAFGMRAVLGKKYEAIELLDEEILKREIMQDVPRFKEIVKREKTLHENEKKKYALLSD